MNINQEIQIATSVFSTVDSLDDADCEPLQRYVNHAEWMWDTLMYPSIPAVLFEGTPMRILEQSWVCGTLRLRQMYDVTDPLWAPELEDVFAHRSEVLPIWWATGDVH